MNVLLHRFIRLSISLLIRRQDWGFSENVTSDICSGIIRKCIIRIEIFECRSNVLVRSNRLTDAASAESKLQIRHGCRYYACMKMQKKKRKKKKREREVARRRVWSAGERRTIFPVLGDTFSVHLALGFTIFRSKFVLPSIKPPVPRLVSAPVYIDGYIDIRDFGDRQRRVSYMRCRESCQRYESSSPSVSGGGFISPPRRVLHLPGRVHNTFPKARMCVPRVVDVARA